MITITDYRLEHLRPHAERLFRQSWFGYVGIWEGKKLYFSPTNQLGYEQMPWEVDANQFACEYIANLKPAAVA